MVIPVTLILLIVTLSKEVGPKVTKEFAVTTPIKLALVPVKYPTVVIPETFKDVNDAFPTNIEAVATPDILIFVAVTIPKVDKPSTSKSSVRTFVIVLPIVIFLLVSLTLINEPNWDNSLLFAIT